MDNDTSDQIALNLQSVRQRIAAACERSGRTPSEITLVTVTKTTPPERIRAACALGLTDVGENRVQEAREKMPALNDLPLRWHMIGHLQSNKAGLAVDLFQFVQSVNSREIAEHLSRRVQARATGRPLPVLLELNIRGEESKSGFMVSAGGLDTFMAAVEHILGLPGLDVQGLMTVAPIVAEPRLARPYFRELRLLRDQLRTRWPLRSWPHLSMGMTDDFEVAIEEGATMIRLGRAIFGARTT